MRILLLLKNLLFILLLTIVGSGAVSAKVASGPQTLGWEGYQGETVVNWLLHQGKSARSTTGPPESSVVAKGAKELKPTLIQENPRNLIPMQTKSEMSGSQVKRLTKDMKQNGYDQSKPVDAWRNPETGRLEIQDGHHRTEAAKKAGLDKIPVQVWE